MATGPTPSAVASFVNKCTKWVVVGSAAGTILWRRDAEVLWAITGGILNAVNAKLLKRCFNHRRPESAAMANKMDPGMPSSHAQGVAYFAAYAAMGVVGGAAVGSTAFVGRSAVALSIATLAVYMSYLRVATGMHTMPQVCVGAAVGVSTALVWRWGWAAVAVPTLARVPWASPLFLATFVAFSAGFGIYMLRTWRFGEL